MFLHDSYFVHKNLPFKTVRLGATGTGTAVATVSVSFPVSEDKSITGIVLHQEGGSMSVVDRIMIKQQNIVYHR